ncbi:MAG: hypothetical protein HY319_17890 [Armatimonadetes bacterium]|nr:hypothetical protein [Armatimonadota bacterium]
MVGEVSGSWALILAFAAWSAWKRHQEILAGVGDLVLDRWRGEIRWGPEGKGPVVISLGELSGVEVERDYTTDSDGDPVTRFCLVLSTRDGSRHRLKEWSDAERAEAFRGWLAKTTNR